jgi:cell wall-associated NlpC family hydrolase
MSNTRSTSLRPSVPFLALLVVACMIVVAPASAAWKTHRAPAAERAALALRATNGQAVEAKRTAGRIDRQLQDLRREQTRLTLVEQAARAKLSAAAPATGDRATALLLVVTRERRALERTRRQLRADLAASRAQVAKAQARRAVVLGGLSLVQRQRVLRADRTRQRQARARRATAHERTLLTPVALAPEGAPGANGVALAARLAAPPRAAAAPGLGAIAAAYALTQLGVPYRAAGYSPTMGFDCSGLLYWAFAQAGAEIPRSSGDIWRAGRRVTRAAAQPGDLVSFHGQGHIGLYLGEGLYVHSTKAGDVVRVHAIADRSDLDGFVRLG